MVSVVRCSLGFRVATVVQAYSRKKARSQGHRRYMLYKVKVSTVYCAVRCRSP